MIINLTQHAATAPQIEAGVVDLDGEGRSRLIPLLLFKGLPSSEEILARANTLAELAAEFACEGGASVMIGGAGFLMGPLAGALRARGMKPTHAFTLREVVEEQGGDGVVTKTAIFRHLGFVPDVEWK